MQIRVQRSGGFAGIEEERAVDTAALDDRAREQLERLVQEADVFALPATVEGDVGADQFRYELAVEDGGRSHAVTFAGESGPRVEALRRLAEAVLSS